MRVVYYYPFGYPFPVRSGADRVACNHLAYFHARGWQVDCLFGEMSHKSATASEFQAAFPWVSSATTLPIPWAGAKSLSVQLGHHDRLRQHPTVRRLFAEPHDYFVTNYAFTAPLALDARPSRLRLLETHDLLSDSFTAEEQREAKQSGPWSAHRRFLFDVEMDLYRAFDRVLMLSPEEYARIAPFQPSRAVPVPQCVPDPGTPAMPDRDRVYDLLFVGSDHAPNRLGLEWFLRRIYLPHLRPHGVTACVVGSVCGGVLVSPDRQLTLRHRVDGPLDAVYRQAKLVVVPLFEGSGMSIKTIEALAAGSAVVATPIGARGLPRGDEAVIQLAMKDDSTATADAILGLLAAPSKLAGLRAAARACYERHFHQKRYYEALDRAFGVGLAAAAA